MNLRGRWGAGGVGVGWGWGEAFSLVWDMAVAPLGVSAARFA